VVAVIFGDSGDSSAAGVDWRLREGNEGGSGTMRLRRRWRGRREMKRGCRTLRCPF
jgi:hypothetical protein